MSDIVERLKKAERGFTHFDAELAGMFGEISPSGLPTCAGYLGIADFTTSVDAAIRLLLAVVPSANCYGVEKDERGFTAYASLNGVREGNWLVEAEHKHSGAIALCLAVLKAVEKGRAALNGDGT